MSLPDDFLSSPTRRSFLRTALAAAASLSLPRFLIARRHPRSFYFLQTATGESWAVDDPVTWALANAHQPTLERACERLVTLNSADPLRVIRLVTRRCHLNLIELRPGQVTVHYWGQHGQGDLHAFFKKHRLARKDILVTLIDRKRETRTVQSGEEFLYGERFIPFWPLEYYCVKAYRKKWERRFVEEPDDWTPAPWSQSNYCWEGVEQRCIPWRVLKSAWRHENAPLCRNCDKPTLLISFGYYVCGFYKRGPIVTRICPLCSRKFTDHSPWDGPQWMMEYLDKPCLPSCEFVFGKPVKYTLPWTPEGQVYERNIRLVQRLNQIDRRGVYGYDVSGHVVLTRKNTTVRLPLPDEEEQMEEWCRRVKLLIPDEE